MDNISYYIYSLLIMQRAIVWSWGINSLTAVSNGLRFKVQGFKFKGIVEVIYNEGTDLFDISLIKRGVIKERIEGIYLDSLVDVIDRYVERTDTYEEDVEAWLHTAI